MADDVNQCVKDAFKILVSITEKSGNLREDFEERHFRIGKYTKERIFPIDTSARER